MSTGSSWRLGLIGSGIAHSLSPRLMANALAQAGETGTYTLFDCATEQAARDVVARLRAGELDGLQVTTPWKPLALDLADAWHRSGAREAGVQARPANTLWRHAGQLVAASTDGAGLTAALAAARVELAGRRVLLLGAGGAGQAVAADLLALGPERLLVCNRTPPAAQRLVAQLGTIWPGRVQWLAWGDTAAASACDVLVHATRLGHGQQPGAPGQPAHAALAGQLDWLPWPLWARQPPLIADLVYAQASTALEALALGHGLPWVEVWPRGEAWPRDAAAPGDGAGPGDGAVTADPPVAGVLGHCGQAMLAFQAARSFALWTGREVDAAQMLAAIRAA